MVVMEICLFRHHDHDTPSHRSPDIPERSTFSWLEHASFALVAFIMQCEFGQPSQCPRTPTDQLLTSVTVGTPDTIESLFGDAWSKKGPDSVASFFVLIRTDMDLFLALSHGSGGARDIVSIYSAGFRVQLKLCLRLHFDSSVGRRPLSLLPPSLPPMDLASQYDDPDKLGSATFLWPWLRDGLAGTPLAGLSFTSGRRWAGLIDSPGAQITDDPMFLKLYLAPPPSADAVVNKVYFRGEGMDNVGSFTLEGAAETESGVVIAVKMYSEFLRREWHGVITPFGMVGVFGVGTDAFGWWWIWPQEWS